jgi:hypothetical protein
MLREWSGSPDVDQALDFYNRLEDVILWRLEQANRFPGAERGPSLRYSALMGVERAGDLPVPVGCGFATAGGEGARTLLVRGGPQGAGVRKGRLR